MAGGGTWTAEEVIAAIIGDPASHTPGTRPIHAPGIGVTGRFQASDVASRYSEAPQFSGAPVPVTVRFSNGVGSAAVPDGDYLVRGMATKFHTGEVTTDDHGVRHGAPDVDLVCMTLPVFFARTMETFLEFVEATGPVPGPKAPQASIWQRICDAFALRPPPVRDMYASDLAAIAFADAHPEALAAAVAMAGLSVPQSYATCAYHGVNAFTVTAGAATETVRFRWEPVAGVRPYPAKDRAKLDLKKELTDRLARAPADFVLRMQVAEAGDDPTDPTVAWPERRRRIVMGQLRIDGLAADQLYGCERLSFDPTVLPAGMGLSGDPTLAARSVVYPQSFKDRLAAAPT